MKLSFTAAVAAAAFSTHASAFKVVVDDNNVFCVVQVKYSGATGTLWAVDGDGNIEATNAAPSGVLGDGNGDPTIAQNGINDPTGEILATVQALSAGAVTVYYPDSGTALTQEQLESLLPNTSPAGTLTPSSLDWCQSYSTFAPEHYCKADGNWVGTGQEGTLGGTLQQCCENKHPASVYNACVEKATGIVPMGDGSWYGDQTDEKCVRNCDVLNLFKPDSSGSKTLHSFAVAPTDTRYECGGLRPQWMEQDYSSASVCCDTVFTSLQKEFCEYKSTTGSAPAPTPAYTGTYKWYVDGSNSVCKKDCIVGSDVVPATSPTSSVDPACGGTIEEASVSLYTSAANCCSAQLAWLPSTGCETRSGVGEGNPTELFWASSDGCREDCTGSDNCEAAPSSAKLYADAEECCKQANNWLDLEWCKTRAARDFGPTSIGTGQWFVDYEDGVCHKDCGNASVECELATSGSLNFFSSASDCCKGSLASVDQDACVQGSNEGLTIGTVPTGKWYVASGGSGSDQPCKQDCETSSGSPCGGIVAKNGIRMYDSASDCCKQAYSWVNEDLCEKQSENAGQHTNLWYVDYGANVCKKDCAVVSTSPECDGYPEEQSTKMFASASACCAAKLSWIPKETCETASTTGVDPTDSDSPGTGAWRKNDSWSYCVLDCKESGNIATGDNILTVQPFTSSNVKQANGEPMVDLVSGAAYPDQCDGVTSDSSATQYTGSVTNCCKSISWVEDEVCYSLSTGELTQKYFPDPSDRTKCVVHQVENTASVYLSAPPVVCALGKVTLPTDVAGVKCVDEIGVSTKLYDSLEDCCEKNVSWDVDSCKYGSQGEDAPGTGKFYIDWSLEQCVQDCSEESTGSSCNGIAKSWQSTFSSAATCCDQIGWVNRRDCQYYQS